VVITQYLGLIRQEIGERQFYHATVRSLSQISRYLKFVGEGEISFKSALQISDDSQAKQAMSGHSTEATFEGGFCVQRNER
jgi:hypothetical protein